MLHIVLSHRIPAIKHMMYYDNALNKLYPESMGKTINYLLNINRHLYFRLLTFVFLVVNIC